MSKVYGAGDLVWNWLLQPCEFVVERATAKTLVVSLRDRSWTRTIRLNDGNLPPDWHDTERECWQAKVDEFDAAAIAAAAAAEEMRGRAAKALFGDGK